MKRPPEQSETALNRLLVLAATFWLVALAPNPSFALFLAVSGVSAYAVLFLLAYFPRNRKDDS
jgi:hypothetical protein